MTFWIGNCISKVGKDRKKSYSRALSGRISNWAKQAGLTQKNLIDLHSLKEFSHLSKALKRLDMFIDPDSRDKGMFSAVSSFTY